MIEQRDGVAVVVAQHVPAVGRHRVRARALVKHGCDVVVEIAVADAEQELVLVEVVGDVAIGEIAKLVAVGEIVDGDDVRFAARVQRLDEIRSDEAGRAGDDDVQDLSSAVVRARRTAPRGATAHSNS